MYKVLHVKCMQLLGLELTQSSCVNQQIGLPEIIVVIGGLLLWLFKLHSLSAFMIDLLIF